jgi:hypothetical protein
MTIQTFWDQLQSWWLPDNLVHLEEQIPKSNEYTEIVGEVLEMKIGWVTQEWVSNLSYEAWRREVESSKECLKMFVM